MGAPDRARFLAEAASDVEVLELVERMLEADARKPNIIDLLAATLSSIRTAAHNASPAAGDS